ncbi:MAG TPA: transcription-repair coupling factor [Opitutae bacterium]|nr:transcription-repair coupling factor [Opitutaceae bacterium]HCR29829.1 transcription-repair coupling factor [Opitutae bacterium]
MTVSSGLLPASSSVAVERLIGVSSEALSPVLEDWANQANQPVKIVIVTDERLAEKTAADLDFFHRQVREDQNRTNIHQLPVIDAFGEDLAAQFDAGSEQIAVLNEIRAASEDSSVVIVSTIEALAQSAPDPKALAALQLELNAGIEHGFDQLLEDLERLDYDHEGLCEAPGQFAKRGGLIDVYPITSDKPYRIDFFGDEIESIKTLDPVTQRSGESVLSITLTASPRMEIEKAKNGILDYFEASVAWALVEPESLIENLDRYSPEGGDRDEGAFWNDLRKSRSGRKDIWTTMSDLDLGVEENSGSSTTYETESLDFYRSYPDESKLADERLADEQAARIRFLEKLQEWEASGERIFIILPSESDERRIREIFRETKSLGKLKPVFWRGDLNEGFRVHFRRNLGRLNWPGLENSKGAVFVTETEIFGRRRNRKVTLRKRALFAQSQVDQLLDFAELVEGEFVVHLQHGIAVYRGITRVDIGGQLREALTLEFDEGILLHVPLQESHLVSRYVGITKTRPKLGRLGSNRWAKTREAAERATLDLAAQLLQIQAKRDSAEGWVCPSDTEWQKEFETAFPYKETPDQMKAIVDAKRDMELSKPMDRLVCGDVGYGKTEVAIRTAFKAVMGGKQVAILVPTTVLAQQHFLNFRDRMAGYPIVVELVSRFRKPGEIKKILQATRNGNVDILIGTHRLIQKDVSFKDLGLVVVDEEQRFGVKHKEVFKNWRETIDILTLSATPIPRTLYMALTGARELSVIETAPLERKPIQTIVKSYDEKLVTEVIRREIARGGQVFYLHNRVQTIDTIALRLQELMPEISFQVGHGQMDEKQLEKVMLDFVDKRFQVLVCTTIIESGLDIPNCNTIIIEGADRFGLGQLYQIRGRVGRFTRQAYAYLLLHKHKRLMDIARKRLKAIRQHNQLGAGFRIAMRDLELRGAGNLLGSEQSGHIVGVGFELYCQLLRQSIARLKGEETAQAIRASVKLDFVYQGEGQAESTNRYEDGYTALKDAESPTQFCEPIQARIPSSYLEETRLRIDFYRRLAMSETPERIRELEAAMKDRFGDFPQELEALLKMAEIRVLAEQKGVLSVVSQDGRLKCRTSRDGKEAYIKLGSRFPRLSSKTALKRLDEIIVFLRNLS